MVTVPTGFHGWYIDAVVYLKKEDAIIASVSSKTIKKWMLSSDPNTIESREYTVPKGVETIVLY